MESRAPRMDCSLISSSEMDGDACLSQSRPAQLRKVPSVTCLSGGRCRWVQGDSACAESRLRGGLGCPVLECWECSNLARRLRKQNKKTKKWETL